MTARSLTQRLKDAAVFSYPEASRLLQTPREFPSDPSTIRSFSIDTRNLAAGDLFVALKGEHSDGHQFLKTAFEKGASGALIDARQKVSVLADADKGGWKVRNLLAVSDPQQAMTALAADYRRSLSVKIVGITGSVGKTTTKEFLYYLLRQQFAVLATSGNLNNHLGVPMMLSRLEPAHKFCVLEMGASHPGEIRYLAGLAGPAGGILTPIGPAHLEGFGTLENVYRTKLELAEGLEKNGPLVVSADDPHLLELIGQRKMHPVCVGASEQAEYRISEVSAEKGTVNFTLNGRWKFSFPGQASFLALNAGLAIAMARSLGMPWEALPQKWQDVGFASGRFRETILPNGVRVIDDSYNANPVSFENALKAFHSLPRTGKKIIVFADMLEMGAEEDRFHRELGEKMARTDADLALAFGKRTRASIEAVLNAKTGCVAKHFDDAAALELFLKDILKPGDAVLFKGSRGMHVEKVLAGVTAMTFKG